MPQVETPAFTNFRHFAYRPRLTVGAGVLKGNPHAPGTDAVKSYRIRVGSHVASQRDRQSGTARPRHRRVLAVTGAICRIANLSWYNRASAHRSRENKDMKAWSVVGLVFAATIFATIPLSPQVTSRGLALNVDQAQAITYGHARRVSRRVDRRDYRQTRRAVRRGVY
jgi:hypothetical protein